MPSVGSYLFRSLAGNIGASYNLKPNNLRRLRCELEVAHIAALLRRRQNAPAFNSIRPSLEPRNKPNKEWCKSFQLPFEDLSPLLKAPCRDTDNCVEDDCPEDLRQTHPSCIFQHFHVYYMQCRRRSLFLPEPYSKDSQLFKGNL